MSSDETRERILAAALDLFSRSGFAAVGTRAIAQAAGVNEVTLFRLFGSKRELYIEVFRRFRLSPSEISLPAAFGGDLGAELASVGASMAALFRHNGKIVRMSMKDMELFPEIKAELHAQPAKLTENVARYFALVSEALPLAAPPERLAKTFVSALMGATLHLQRVAAEEALEEFLDDFCPVFARGMVAVPA